jgi:hypothetical protein
MPRMGCGWRARRALRGFADVVRSGAVGAVAIQAAVCHSMHNLTPRVRFRPYGTSSPEALAEDGR